MPFLFFLWSYHFFFLILKFNSLSLFSHSKLSHKEALKNRLLLKGGNFKKVKKHWYKITIESHSLRHLTYSLKKKSRQWSRIQIVTLDILNRNNENIYC